LFARLRNWKTEGPQEPLL